MPTLPTLDFCGSITLDTHLKAFIVHCARKIALPPPGIPPKISSGGTPFGYAYGYNGRIYGTIFRICHSFITSEHVNKTEWIIAQRNVLLIVSDGIVKKITVMSSLKQFYSLGVVQAVFSKSTHPSNSICGSGTLDMWKWKTPRVEISIMWNWNTWHVKFLYAELARLTFKISILWRHFTCEISTCRKMWNWSELNTSCTCGNFDKWNRLHISNPFVELELFTLTWNTHLKCEDFLKTIIQYMNRNLSSWNCTRGFSSWNIKLLYLVVKNAKISCKSIMKTQHTSTTMITKIEKKSR